MTWKKLGMRDSLDTYGDFLHLYTLVHSPSSAGNSAHHPIQTADKREMDKQLVKCQHLIYSISTI